MFLCEMRNIALLSIHKLKRVVEKFSEFLLHQLDFLKIIQIFTLQHFLFTLTKQYLCYFMYTVLWMINNSVILDFLKLCFTHGS
jgi:hypothetical protein